MANYQARHAAEIVARSFRAQTELRLHVCPELLKEFQEALSLMGFTDLIATINTHTQP